MKLTNLLVGITTLVLLAVGIKAITVLATAQTTRTTTAQPVHDAAGYQRFIPMPRQPESLNGVPWSGVFALDTKTGSLCRTYDGGLEENSVWKGLDRCLDLYRKF